jgi:tetratricopeptide (TPR) repeat protein
MPPRLVVLPSLLAALLACDSQPSQPAAKTDPVAQSAQPAPADEAIKAKQEAERHTLAAVELEAAGRLVEARAEVELALAAGAGRDAKLLAAKLAILRDDLDVAAKLLEPLAADGSDALVLYNLGLIAQRRGTYNTARTRYLAALKADPTYAPARYNLALLTWEAGIKEEARHHASKFIEMSPGDPRIAELRTRLELDVQPAPAGPPTATPPKP